MLMSIFNNFAKCNVERLMAKIRYDGSRIRLFFLVEYGSGFFTRVGCGSGLSQPGAATLSGRWVAVRFAISLHNVYQ